jgi:hypothetical protein
MTDTKLDLEIVRFVMDEVAQSLPWPGCRNEKGYPWSVSDASMALASIITKAMTQGEFERLAQAFNSRRASIRRRSKRP